MIDYKQLNQSELNDELIHATSNNDVAKVRYLLTSPELDIHPDINLDNDYIFNKACQYGYVDIVKFILETPSLNRELGPALSFKNAAQMAYQNGHTNLLKYLIDDYGSEYDLNHFHLSKKIIDAACTDGDLEMIKYVLGNPKLSQHIDISAKDNEYFRTACAWEKWNVVEYFIFELEIPKTSGIENFIRGYENVVEMFSKREFKESLQSELDVNNNIIKKVKI